jgi:hypothetical protein
VNDLERQVKDLLEHDASEAPHVTAPPPRLRRRVRGRQLGTAAIASVTVVAIVLAGFAGIRAIDRSSPDGTPASDPWAGYPVYTRTATISNVRISSPSDLYLTEPDTIGCAATFDCDPYPIFQLSTYDPGLTSPVCGSIPPDGGVALVVSADVSGQASTDPAWPISIDPLPPLTDGACGSGRYLRFTAGSTGFPFVVWIGAGSEAPAADLGRILDSFGTLAFPTRGLGQDHRAAYVVAGGESAAGPWRLEVAPSERDASGGDVDLQLVTPTGGSVIEGIAARDVRIEQAGGDPTYGAVTKSAATVELRLEGGGPPIDAYRSPLPPSLPFAFDVFFAPHEGDVPGVAVALDEDGAVLGTAVEAATTPLTSSGRYLIARFRAFGARWELSAARSGTCSYLMDLDRQRGSGGCGEFSGVNGGDPPEAFVFGPLTYGVNAAVVTGDGRTYPAIATGSTPDGRTFFAVALEGRGPGTLQMLDGAGDVLYRSRVEWPDHGQVIDQGRSAG